MKQFLKGLGIFLSLVGVGIVSAFAVVALLLQQKEVRVPDLRGQDIVSVINTLAQQGLHIKVDRREPHPTLPRDAIISQTPSPGSGIKKGRPVRVVVSQGPSNMLAPRLVGEPYRKADMMIRQLGFLPGTVARVFSESVSRDTVIAQDPPADSSINAGESISLLVSAGKKPDLYVMPKLTGKKADEAVRDIDRIGLQHRTLYRAATDKKSAMERIVIDQKPMAGSPIAADATVDIVLSK
jgi:eukaryotic-like serine/threonine-protein kinase